MDTVAGIISGCGEVRFHISAAWRVGVDGLMSPRLRLGEAAFSVRRSRVYCPAEVKYSEKGLFSLASSGLSAYDGALIEGSSEVSA